MKAALIGIATGYVLMAFIKADLFWTIGLMSTWSGFDRGGFLYWTAVCAGMGWFVDHMRRADE